MSFTQVVKEEILNAKNDLEKTSILINDSLEQVEELEKLYEKKLKPYAAQLPEYSKLEQNLKDLHKKRKNILPQTAPNIKERMEENIQFKV